MRSNFFIFSLITLLFSCTAKEATVETADALPENIKEWTISRPQSSMYYIGIGRSIKPTNPTGYAKAAKDEALRDLASEIEVNVNSSSLLYTLEREYKFEEEFTDNIKTTTNLNLEGYEIVDSYETDKEYWIYYRLSKEKYASLKAEKKLSALNRSLNFYSLGKEAEANNSIKNAAAYYIQSLQNLSEYWNENNEVEFEGKLIALDIETYSALTKLISSIKLTPSPTEVILSIENKFIGKVEITAINEDKQIILPQLPLNYSYYGRDGKTALSVSTDNSGMLNISVIDADTENFNNSLKVAVNRDELLGEAQKNEKLNELIKAIPTPELSIPIRIQKPLFYIQSSEANLGNTMQLNQIASAITGSLSRKGYEFAKSERDADLIIKVKSNTAEGSESDGFYISYLNIDVQVFNQSENKLVQQLSKNNVKGVDLNFEKAGIKAYNNLIKSIDQELVNPLINSLL